VVNVVTLLNMMQIDDEVYSHVNITVDIYMYIYICYVYSAVNVFHFTSLTWRATPGCKDAV